MDRIHTLSNIIEYCPKSPIKVVKRCQQTVANFVEQNIGCKFIQAWEKNRSEIEIHKPTVKQVRPTSTYFQDLHFASIFIALIPHANICASQSNEVACESRIRIKWQWAFRIIYMGRSYHMKSRGKALQVSVHGQSVGKISFCIDHCILAMVL